MRVIEVFNRKNQKIKINEEAVAISIGNKDGKYRFFNDETEKALKMAVGTSYYERDFSGGYSHSEYKRLTEKYREPVEPLVFRKENKDKIKITFSDFKNHTAGYYRGYECAKYNNLWLGARGETIVVTKQQLLEGLEENLKRYIEWVEPFLKTVPWRTEEKEKKLKQYKVDKMLIINS